MKFKLLVSLFLLISVYQNELSAQSENVYEINSLNMEQEDSQVPCNWVVNQGELVLDSIKKYSGRHALKLNSSLGKENNQLFSEAVYPISAFYMEGDRVFYRIDGDSLEVKGLFAYNDAQKGNIACTIIQNNSSSKTSEQSFELNQISGSSEWTPFYIKTAILDSLNNFSIKIKSTGNVNVWFDDLQLTVDGKSISDKQEFCFMADNDNEFDNGSSISIPNVTAQQLIDLQVLTKVWGFIKYYHPEVTKGNLQWDYELFRIIPNLLNASTKEERNDYLTKWVKQMNKNSSLDKQTELPLDTVDCYVLPNLNWLEDINMLGSELVVELSKIKNAQRGDWNYYIQFDNNLSQIFSTQFIAEKQYPSISWEDQGFRLLTFMRYWNAIEYCFPYKSMTDVNWNDVLNKYLPFFIHPTSQIDYINAIYALTAEINDSHGSMRTVKPYMFAAIFVQAGEGVMVKKSFSCQLHAGDIILSMDGKSIDAVIEERKRFVAASNEARRKYFVVSELNWWNNDEIDVVCLRGKDTISVTLTDFNLTKEIPNCTSEIKQHNYQHALSTKEIAYLDISELTAESITQKEDKIMSSKGIILDCRGYPICNSFYDKMSDILFSQPAFYMEIATLDIKEPGVFRFYHKFTHGNVNPNAYKGKLVILADSKTQSAAETAVMVFQQVPNSITVGSKSSGANGSATFFALPSGIETIFTGEGCYYPNRENIQREGVKIDVIVNPTLESVLQGRDEQLEKAIEIISN